MQQLLDRFKGVSKADIISNVYGEIHEKITVVKIKDLISEVEKENCLAILNKIERESKSWKEPSKELRNKFEQEFNKICEGEQLHAYLIIKAHEEVHKLWAKNTKTDEEYDSDVYKGFLFALTTTNESIDWKSLDINATKAKFNEIFKKRCDEFQKRLTLSDSTAEKKSDRLSVFPKEQVSHPIIESIKNLINVLEPFARNENKNIKVYAEDYRDKLERVKNDIQSVIDEFITDVEKSKKIDGLINSVRIEWFKEYENFQADNPDDAENPNVDKNNFLKALGQVFSELQKLTFIKSSFSLDGPFTTAGIGTESPTSALPKAEDPQIPILPTDNRDKASSGQNNELTTESKPVEHKIETGISPPVGDRVQDNKTDNSNKEEDTLPNQDTSPWARSRQLFLASVILGGTGYGVYAIEKSLLPAPEADFDFISYIAMMAAICAMAVFAAYVISHQAAKPTAAVPQPNTAETQPLLDAKAAQPVVRSDNTLSSGAFAEVKALKWLLPAVIIGGAAQGLYTFEQTLLPSPQPDVDFIGMISAMVAIAAVAVVLAYGAHHLGKVRAEKHHQEEEKGARPSV